MADNQLNDKTIKKPLKGKGRGNPDIHKHAKKFSKEYQPSAKAKKTGWAKNKTGRQLLQAFSDNPFHGYKDSQLIKKMSEYFGVEITEITNQVMVWARIFEIGIQSGNLNALMYLANQMAGMPKQSTDLTSGGKPLPGNETVVEFTLSI